MKYIDAIKQVQRLLSDNGYLFIGQSTKFKGTGLFWTLEDVPMENRIEMIVQEDMQMGMSHGMALKGLKVCSIFPRVDFLICALPQLVLHLDKMKEMSDSQYNPKIIIRTALGSVAPLFPGPQHNNDFTGALKLMLKNIDVIKLENAGDILPAYKKAMESEHSTILIEIP